MDSKWKLQYVIVFMNRSTKFERDLATARQWVEDPDPEFQTVAKEWVRELECRLREQKIREDEEEFLPG
jgi:hypothetical protein